MDSADQSAPLSIAAPGATNRTVELLDNYPTLAKTLPSTRAQLEGRGLSPLLDDPRAKWNDPAYNQVVRGGQGTRFKGRGVRAERTPKRLKI